MRIESFDFDRFDPLATYLFVIHATRIPPHLGFAANGLYYSLKFGGVDLNVPIQRVTELLMTKQIPSLLVQVDHGTVRGDVDAIFSNLQSTTIAGTTCLEPLKTIFSCNAETVHDLIDEMTHQKAIVKIIGLNLPQGYNGIPNYSKHDVKAYLASLE